MDVKLLRIDSRLVHGQVANNWAGSLGAEAILAVSDGAANDELRKTLMLQTGGGKVKVHVLGVEKAARVYKNPKYEALKAVIVVETPADVVRLLDLPPPPPGIEVDEVNVGGMTFKQGTKALSQAVYISDDDAAAFQEIDKRGITQYIQQVPSTEPLGSHGGSEVQGLHLLRLCASRSCGGRRRPHPPHDRTTSPTLEEER